MKKILIFGATSMIAEYCARHWASAGHVMYLVGRNESRLEVIRADLEIRGASQVFIHCADLNDCDAHDSLLNKGYDVLGVVDIVLIAHGTLSNQQECELMFGTALSEIQTNAISTISLLTLVANKFESRRAGTICVISSVAGDRGRASNYVYGSCKAMVTAFTSGLRQRLHESNVKVVTIKPGLVDTPMTAHLKKGLLWAKPELVASKIVKAIEKKNGEVYVPPVWGIIMALVIHLPTRLFLKFPF